MGDFLNIFSGPAQVALYDATNEELFLGYLGEEIEIESESPVTGISDGNKVSLGKIIKFACPLMQTDLTFLASLKTRRTYKQTIYVVAGEMLVKLSNMFVSVAMNRQFKSGETHKFALTAQTKVPADLESIINLLGSNGNCNTENGSTGLALGWTATGAPTIDVDTSHLADRGNEQRFEVTGTPQTLYNDVICPVEFPVKITVSAYVKDLGGTGADFMFGIKTKEADGTPAVDSEMTNKTLTASQETRISQEINLSPGSDVGIIAVTFTDNSGATADLGIDDVQVEFGELTGFTDNTTE